MMGERDSNQSRPLWHKDAPAADWVTRFTVGEDYRWDRHLLPYDVAATRAHAWGLSQIKILSEAELRDIDVALNELGAEIAAGRISVRIEDEDCHTVIEHFLTDRLGEVGKKIHTGRSRNDQVLAALRLWLKDQLRELASETGQIASLLCAWGDVHDRVLMPGYTHLQRAMPSTLGLWSMGFAELLVSDLQGLAAAFDQIDVSPLGSAAGYGVPYLKLPRQEVAEKLGFKRVQTHVTAVQLSRGKLELHVVHASAQIAATLNRLASDLILFSTSEFAFVGLPAEFCTGSSIMPQKRNPDVLELTRAAYHRIVAEMNVLLTLPANLPSGYHRDLQLTKEAVMRAVSSTHDVLEAMNHLLQGVRFDEERMHAATTNELFATARALDLVQQGVPFREAYRRVALDEDDAGSFDVQDALDAYHVDGFPGQSRPDFIRKQIEEQIARFAATSAPRSRSA